MSFVNGLKFFQECYVRLGDFMDAAALINSAINFILYCVMSKQFRRTFVATFHLQWCVDHRPRCPAFCTSLCCCSSNSEDGEDGGRQSCCCCCCQKATFWFGRRDSNESTDLVHPGEARRKSSGAVVLAIGRARKGQVIAEEERSGDEKQPMLQQPGGGHTLLVPGQNSAGSNEAAGSNSGNGEGDGAENNGVVVVTESKM